MNLETGNPIIEGRYVAYVPGVLGWLQPVIVTWTKGKWHFLHSTQEYTDPVHGWIGPLPVLKIERTWDEVFSDKRRTEAGWVDIGIPTTEEDPGGCDCSAGFGGMPDHAPSCPKYSPPEYDL